MGKMPFSLAGVVVGIRAGVVLIILGDQVTWTRGFPSDALKDLASLAVNPLSALSDRILELNYAMYGFMTHRFAPTLDPWGSAMSVRRVQADLMSFSTSVQRGVVMAHLHRLGITDVPGLSGGQSGEERVPDDLGSSLPHLLNLVANATLGRQAGVHATLGRQTDVHAPAFDSWGNFTFPRSGGVDSNRTSGVSLSLPDAVLQQINLQLINLTSANLQEYPSGDVTAVESQMKHLIQYFLTGLFNDSASPSPGNGWVGPPALRRLSLEDLRRVWPLAAGTFEALRCPISKEVMTDPVVTADGVTYERNAIEQWLRTSRVSPRTGLLLSNVELSPNYALRDFMTHLIDLVEAPVS